MQTKFNSNSCCKKAEWPQGDSSGSVSRSRDFGIVSDDLGSGVGWSRQNLTSDKI